MFCLISQFLASLSGVVVEENVTIHSVVNSSEILANSLIPIVITLLAPTGGSDQLVASLTAILQSLASLFGVQIDNPPQRFGKQNLCTYR